MTKIAKARFEIILKEESVKHFLIKSTL